MNYEIVCILSPKIVEKELKDHIQKLIELLEKNEAKDIQDNLWGKKPLAYDIKGFSDGYYVQLNFSIDPEKIKELNKQLKLNEQIIRFLITNQEEASEVKVLQNEDKKESEDVVEEKKPEEKAKEVKKPEKEPEETKVEEKVEEKKESPEPKLKEKKEEKVSDLDKKIDEVLEKDIVD
jgi:small subunit ribosomal protein S6